MTDPKYTPPDYYALEGIRSTDPRKDYLITRKAEKIYYKRKAVMPEIPDAYVNDENLETTEKKLQLQDMFYFSFPNGSLVPKWKLKNAIEHINRNTDLNLRPENFYLEDNDLKGLFEIIQLKLAEKRKML